MNSSPTTEHAGIGSHAAILAILFVILSPLNALAQVLDQQVNTLLANNCAGLGTGGFPTPNLTGLAPNLAAICNTPQTQGSSSAGGGAASVQGSAASILNRTLLGRLDDLRNEEREGSAQPSSMRFNPLGMMAMAGMRNLNVSSPFYAATTAGGGSTRSEERRVGKEC